MKARLPAGAEASSSSLDSFHSAISRAPTSHPPTPIRNPIPSPASPITSHRSTPKSTQRGRWFFQKDKVPTAPSSPQRQPRRSRGKDRLRLPRLDDSSRPLNRNTSDRSSLASALDDRRHHPSTNLNPPSPDSADDHHGYALQSEASAEFPQEFHSRQPYSSSLQPPQEPADTDDWGLDELSDDDAEPLPLRSQSVTSQHQPARYSLHASDTGTYRDAITLRAFDENLEQTHTSAAPVNYVIGVFDPAAETDDWADDFVLEQNSLLPSSSSRTVEEPGTLPKWSMDDIVPDEHTPWHPAHGIVHGIPDFLSQPDQHLRLRPVPPTAFATPTLTHSSLLMFPSIGYQAAALHPSCARVKELFSRYDVTIRTHFDALVRDCGGAVALDHRFKDVYLLSGDADVSSLTASNADFSVDVLLWKLEWATLCNDYAQRAAYLLGLSQVYKDLGKFRDSMCIIGDALDSLSEATPSNFVLTLAVELEYENCVLHRGAGDIAEAGRALKRAIDHSNCLAEQEELAEDLPGPQQRGLWWQLRCKFMQAEMAYDFEEHDKAVQFYSEYIVESITRMIGLTAPPKSSQSTLGSEYMRYCLFSPRCLVLALWTTLLSLGDMRSFAAAAEIGGLTSLVASAFGYDDANTAASGVRTRIKEISVELRQQYEEISNSILKNDDIDRHDMQRVEGAKNVNGPPFDYDIGDFGDVGNDNVEDWDAQLERELNITIERCDADQKAVDESKPFGFESSNEAAIVSKNTFAMPLPGSMGTDLKEGPCTKQKTDEKSENWTQHTARWVSGPQQGPLIEAELRQYLGRVAGAASTLSAQQMYPRPTQPFEGHLMGPREHENFLRRFVMGKDPSWLRSRNQRIPTAAQWCPSEECNLHHDAEPVEDIDDFSSSMQILSAKWGLRLLEAVWKVIRSQVSSETKRLRCRRVILKSFSKVAQAAKKIPAHDEDWREDRLETLAALLDVLRLAREVITCEGTEAVWFSRACKFLSTIAATVTPAAKAAVELFLAESRAHCGVKAVVSSQNLERCARGSDENSELDKQVDDITNKGSENPKSNAVIPPLRQSVVDLLHALYWRTKAGFDDSSSKNSLERLLHAEVASSLFLTGSGVSPVDGSPINGNLQQELHILNIPQKKATTSSEGDPLVDETRRVSIDELIPELQTLWSTLPSSAGSVRAKVSFALAHHSKMDLRDYARAERFLFDGLRSLHTVSAGQTLPDSFFSRTTEVSPVSMVSSPLAGAILTSYGSLTLSHSKYRYGIAAFEAAADAQCVRNMDKRQHRSSVANVVNTALANNDWKRALHLLYHFRCLVEPQDGLRNEFLQLCVQLHSICLDAGCFEASIVPLRAYSSLVYEERLRILLQKYKRRLAKKSKSKVRRYFPGTPLPKMLPGNSVFPNRRNNLASFFETPMVTPALDTTLRLSTALIDRSTRHSNATVPVPNNVINKSGANRFTALLLQLHVALRHQSPSKKSSLPKQELNTPRNELSDDPILKDKDSSRDTVTGSRHDSNFEEEQRELLRIEAEQDASADSNRFRVELLRAQTEYARANYLEADLRCRGLLGMSIPHASRYKAWEIMARIRLKKREITRCLEFIDQMEKEYQLADAMLAPSGKNLAHHSGDGQRLSLFRLHDPEKDLKESDAKSFVFVPQVVFLRLTAFLYGGRLEEALHLADKALEVCKEHSFWDQGRLHYLRGRILYNMSSSATASFQGGGESATSPRDAGALNVKLTEFTMAAFETASRYYEAAGDEICTAKSDLLWARTCIDFLFRRVVLRAEAGGGLQLSKACALVDRRIIIEDVIDTIYNVLHIASSANVPLLLIDSMAALAEVKCIMGQPASSWSLWVTEAWKLFSRLFTGAEDFTVVLCSLAPVSTLGRLHSICGRLVRLVLCNENPVGMSSMNKHLRLFEAYVTLQISIDRKMNLASTAHRQNETSGVINDDRPDQSRSDSMNIEHSKRRLDSQGNPTGDGSERTSNVTLPKVERHSVNEEGTRNVPEENMTRPSNSTSETMPPRRPEGAFLHILGNEGIALGRQGLSFFINRPRKQVISAVKETGAVLIPMNFFSNSKTAPTDAPHQLGRDAEMIFPFKPNLGLGAMGILSDSADGASSIHFTHAENSTESLPPHGSSDTARTSFSKNDSARQKRPPIPHSKYLGDGDSEMINEASRTRLGTDLEGGSDVQNSHRIENQERVPTPRKDNGGAIPECSSHNPIADLVKLIQDEFEGGNLFVKGSSSVFGTTTAHRVWSHMHRIKTETKKYMHGEISLEQLHERNRDALESWVHCIPPSQKGWTVPESIGRRLVYILYAHGVVGYYAVDRGGSIERIAFGGKQGSAGERPSSYMSTGTAGTSSDGSLRSPTDSERSFLSELVKGFRRDNVWHKNRDSEIVNGIAKNVLRAPRLVLQTSTPAQKSRSRPIVLIADLPLQIFPWELFFDHVVIRSHCLLDVIRGLQDGQSGSSSGLHSTEDPAVAATRRIVRFMSFGPSRREVLDLERTEEARRQQLAFQALLRLNHMNPSSLSAFLNMGGFTDPTAVNAVARPTGPLSSPLSQSRKAVKLFGMRISANIGRRNYPHMEFLRVSALGSATTWDLREAAMVVEPNGSDKDEPKRDLGAYIPVFMFSYAELVDSSDSVFGLRRVVPNGVLMFTPAIHMKVLARHLEDDELRVEIARASGRMYNRIFPDVAASARILVEYVSRFSREKRIPIVVFLGHGLVDLFPRKKGEKIDGGRRPTPAVERLVQLSGARGDYIRS